MRMAAGFAAAAPTSGSKAWIFRYMLHGKPHNMGLGPYPGYFARGSARERANAVVGEHLLDGIDPIEARKLTRMATIVKAAKAMTFPTMRRKPLSPRIKASWRNAQAHGNSGATPLFATYVFPDARRLPVAGDRRWPGDEGDRAHLASPSLSGEPGARPGRERAGLGDGTGLSPTGENPARWKGHLDKMLPSARAKLQRVAHHPALSLPPR